jgi:Ca-activated chloride channel family protein
MTLGLLSLTRPWWLLGLPLLALLCWRLWRTADSGVALWRGAIDSHLLPHLLVGAAAPRWRLGALAGAALIALLALAGPTLDLQPEQVPVRAATRVLVLDLSPQMTPIRLERIRLKLLDLLRALSYGQTALVVYGGEPYLVVPPTTDTAAIALFVPDLASEAVPVPGNRPQLALSMASGVLARSGAAAGDVLWIRAGQAEAGVPDAMPAGVRLSIWQADTDDSSVLAAAAQRSGGILAHMRADDADVRQLAAALNTGRGWNKAPRSDRRNGADIGYWLLPLLLPLAALAFRRGVLALLIGPFILIAGLQPRPAMAFDPSLPAPLADYSAWRMLEAGRPAAAAERFADRRWRAAAHYRAGNFEQAASLLAGQEDADSYYNRGNALARQGQLTEALDAYDAALKLHADDADTRHNRDLVQRLIKPPSPPPKGSTGGAAPQSGNGPKNSGQAPPAAGQQRQSQARGGDAEREAALLAEQWLRRVPDQPGTLLRRKLQLEHRRRLAGGTERSW